MSFTGLKSTDLADRRVLITEQLSEGCHRTVISDSTNADSGSSPTSLLRPGNVLLKDDATGQYFDDATSGDASTPAQVDGTHSSNWASKTVEIQIDGQSIVTVTLSAGAGTLATAVSDLNANGAFAAHCIASNPSGSTIRIKSLRVGADVHLKAIGNHADVFASSTGVAARGADGDWVVTVEPCRQTDPNGAAADAKVHVVDRGHFDESNLIWGGSSTLHQDFKRVMLRRGSKFES